MFVLKGIRNHFLQEAGTIMRKEKGGNMGDRSYAE